MEISSGGCGGGTGGGGGGDDQPLHGLQFGKKIYFEDATAPSGGSGSGTSANASSSSRAPAGAGRKGKAAAVPAVPAPPRCQVEGCDVDLSGSKTYYCRHKVCSMHSKAPRVVVAGLEQRFCQQCSRFHQLPEFDNGKRSCRRRLAGHNERRRKPPPGPLASRYGRLAASFEEPGRYRSFLLDFSYPRVPSSVRDAWPAVRPGYRMPSEIQWQGNLDLRPHTGYGPHAYGSHGFPGPELPPGGCLTGVAADSSCALSLLSSTQPWDTTTHGASHDHRSTAMSVAAGFDGNPVAVSPSIMASNYMPPPSNPWNSSRGHEGGRTVLHQQLPHNVQLHEVHPAAGSSQHGHFSGELELALQGNRPAPGPRGDDGSGGNTFDHPGSSSNWSL